MFASGFTSGFPFPLPMFRYCAVNICKYTAYLYFFEIILLGFRLVRLNFQIIKGYRDDVLI